MSIEHSKEIGQQIWLLLHSYHPKGLKPEARGFSINHNPQICSTKLRKTIVPKPLNFLLIELVPAHSIMQSTYLALILRPITI
jgi:hypothetical protein